jgi:hypothetical protein
MWTHSSADHVQESLAVSGKVHAANVQIFAEDRLAANVTTVRLKYENG